MKNDLIKEQIEKSFKATYEKEEENVRLTLLDENEKTHHLSYAITEKGFGVLVTFTTSELGIFEAESKEILASKYSVSVWLKFITEVRTNLLIARGGRESERL